MSSQPQPVAVNPDPPIYIRGSAVSLDDACREFPDWAATHIRLLLRDNKKLRREVREMRRKLGPALVG